MCKALNVALVYRVTPFRLLVITLSRQVETGHSATEFRDSNTYYIALDSMASLLEHSFTSIYTALIVSFN